MLTTKNLVTGEGRCPWPNGSRPSPAGKTNSANTAMNLLNGSEHWVHLDPTCSHLFRLVCDQAPHGNSRSNNPAPGPESVRYYAIMAIAWCSIGDPKPAPEPVDRKRVERVAMGGSWAARIRCRSRSRPVKLRRRPGISGGGASALISEGASAGSAARHSARRRHCALNVVYRTRSGRPCRLTRSAGHAPQRHRRTDCAATHKRGDHHLRCGDHSRPPSEPFSIVLLKRTSAAAAMASFI